MARCVYLRLIGFVLLYLKSEDYCYTSRGKVSPSVKLCEVRPTESNCTVRLQGLVHVQQTVGQPHRGEQNE